MVSGVRDYKWGNPGYVVAPRLMNLYTLAADGTLAQDVTGAHPTFGDVYTQSPHFRWDSDTLVYEGDDDIDTGDRIYTYTLSTKAFEQVFPAAVHDMDFNTPCALPDDRIAFWESWNTDYQPRLYDPGTMLTTTLLDVWVPFSGYIRCR